MARGIGGGRSEVLVVEQDQLLPGIRIRKADPAGKAGVGVGGHPAHVAVPQFAVRQREEGREGLSGQGVDLKGHGNLRLFQRVPG